jgi:hypothetical protein
MTPTETNDLDRTTAGGEEEGIIWCAVRLVN